MISENTNCKCQGGESAEAFVTGQFQAKPDNGPEDVQQLAALEQRCPFLTEGTMRECGTSEELVQQDETALLDYEKVVVEGTGSCILGKGSFGQVVLMRHRPSMKLVAVKVIDKKVGYGAEALRVLAEEINIHKRLVHENVVKMHAHIEGRRQLYIVMDYASRGTLFQLIRRKGKLSEKEAFYFFTQVCNAVHFLHKHRLVHRDIKPENLLLAENGRLKLCDFGCCAECQEERKTFCGTAEYIAPEIIQHQGYRENADIWSLGILLYEMLHGHSPFRAPRDQDVLGRVLSHKLVFGDQVKDDARAFISAILDPNPARRPNVVELFSLPWARRLQAEFHIQDRISQASGSSTKLPVSAPASQRRSEGHPAPVVSRPSTGVNTNAMTSNRTTATSGSGSVKSAEGRCEEKGAGEEVPTHLLYDYPVYKTAVSGIKQSHAQKHLARAVSIAGLKPALRMSKQKDKAKNQSFWDSVLSFGTNEGL
jgi:serine/threonine protein kinase